MDLQINRAQLDQINLDPGGVVVTAKGDHCDFVSRFFTPQATILEDPVTGSAHCSLVPFWAEQLQKNELDAEQRSQRGGVLKCSLVGDKVVLVGQARTYAVGTFVDGVKPNFSKIKHLFYKIGTVLVSVGT